MLKVLRQIPLACTVRGCGEPLERQTRVFVCPRGHSYDIARSGYVNLLQPQDRRSPHAGDDRNAVDARVRLLSAGIGRPTIEHVVALVTRTSLPDRSVIAELGSGTGDLLAAIARTMGDGADRSAIGIDLSVAAAERAARSFPSLTWVVANADRRLPILDERAHLVVSMHARRQPEECARILASGGKLIVAIPAPDDLIELRESVQGQAVQRDRAEQVISEHRPFFALHERSAIRERHHLEPALLRDLLRGTYRGARLSTSATVESLTALDVTVASDVLTFHKT